MRLLFCVCCLFYFSDILNLSNKNISIKGKIFRASNVGRVCGTYLDELVIIDNKLDTVYFYEFNILHNWYTLGKFGNSCDLFIDSTYTFFLREVEFEHIDPKCFYVSLNLNSAQKRIEYRNKFFNQYFINDTTDIKFEVDPYLDCDSIIGRKYHCMLVEVQGRLYKLDSINPCVR